MSDIPGVPSDIEAEQAALGAMMSSAAALADCLETLNSRDFTRPAHQEIFAAIAAMSARGETADPITVKAELEKRRTLPKTGGAPYLHTLIASVPVTAAAAVYAARVRDLAVRWRLAEGGIQIRQSALSGGTDADEQVEAAYRILDEAAGSVTVARARSVADLAGPALDAIEKGPDEPQGIGSGWPDLDLVIPGFRPGELITVGGRPGMGKSVVLLNVAAHAGITLGLPVLVCSLEMSAQECMERMYASQAGVELGHIRSRSLDERDWGRLSEAYGRLSQAGTLMISDDPYLTIQGIRSDLRAMRRAGNPAQLVVIDYLQLMTSGKRSENRQAEVSDLSRSLKLLAKELEVPVLIGSQLNRGPEQRTDKKPLLADLRESGSVEMDSDIVILLYRQDAYEQDSSRAGEIDLIVAKNRQGAQATVTLTFQGYYGRIAPMARREWSPSAAIGDAA